MKVLAVAAKLVRDDGGFKGTAISEARTAPSVAAGDGRHAVNVSSTKHEA
jgi:hypothetical protein